MVDGNKTMVGGNWIEASDGSVVRRVNPADSDDVVAEVPSLGPDDVERAVAHADEARRGWRDEGLLARGRILLDAADIVRSRGEEIARDVVREMGKTSAEARAEVGAAAAFFEHFGGLGRAAAGELLADRRASVEAWWVREPLGTVCLITPWNDPLATPARKLGPALISGNCVVLKPSEITSLSALHLGAALEDAGIPPGVLNIVTGPPERVSDPLLDDDRIDAVSFTGSYRVGLMLQQRLAGRMRVQTEMGGKNAALVLADADVAHAAATIIGAAMGQAGQRCTATSRVVAHREVAVDLEDALIARLEALTVGPGEDEATDVGPLVTEAQLDQALAAVEQARSDGARIATGGVRLTGAAHDRGHFMAPTLVCDVRRDTGTWCDEIFGPVLAAVTVDSLEEGIDAVNDSVYGLSASVFTRNLEHAHVFAREAEAGQVAVNLPTIGWDVHVPFGGFRQSGSPFKEHGTKGLDFYTRIKSVAIGFGSEGR